ncbi:MAG TPA: pathogenicity-like protein [Xanthomonadaceae bacterium]|nr:pathogenicity-like protein [Xanthomonadaceae bacterium]
MRQVFTSQRLENVEGVADLLRQEGIEVRITNGRSYKGNRRGTFKYSRPDAGPLPAVWVIRSEDQPRARALLRGAGLLATTRPTDAFLGGGQVVPDEAKAPPDPQRKAMRIKIVLIAAIVLVVMLQYLR